MTDSETTEQEHFDIFISYAHEDKKGILGDWVSDFYVDLDALIQIKMGQPALIYKDDGQRSNGGPLRDQIKKAIGKTEFLLAICSPSYIKSDFCNWEFKKFLESKGVDEALKRVIRVDKEALPDTDTDIYQLKQMKGYRFYKYDKQKQKIVSASKHVEKLLYADLITDVATHIAHELKSVSQVRENTIYLARTNDSLSDERNELEKELQLRGFHVVPTALGADPAAARDKARKYLQRSSLAIHLIDDQYDPLPESEESIDQIQFEEAQKVDELRVFALMPENSRNRQQSTFLESVANSNIEDVLHDSYSFKEEVMTAARELREAFQTLTPKTNSNTYLYYTQQDFDQCQQEIDTLVEALIKGGCEVFEPDFRQEDPHNLLPGMLNVVYFFGAVDQTELLDDIKLGKDLATDDSNKAIYLSAAYGTHVPGARVRKPQSAELIRGTDEGPEAEPLQRFISLAAPK